MSRILGNIFKILIFASMGLVIAWYSFDYFGLLGLFTEFFFTAIGWLLAKSWTNPEKNKSDPHLESQSLNEMDINASVVESKDMIDKIK